MCNFIILLLQRSRDEQRVLDHLTQNSTQNVNAMKLLSAMLHNAWPSGLKDEKLDEKEKDLILLKHLLTWSTWQGFLKFIGK